MPAPASPPSGSPALRRIRAVVIDPRLAIGALLVVGSTAGVMALVTASDTRAEMYVTPVALTPGDRILPSELEVHSASVGALSTRYLRPGDIPDGGLVATRSIAAGELVPASAVGSTKGSRLSAIVVSTAGALPTGLGAGATVDLWAAREDEESGGFGTPTILVPSAIVVRLIAAETLVAGSEVTAIELLVPREDVARVLEATANDAVLSVVPTSLPVAD